MPFHFNLKLSHVALSLMLPLSCMLACFSTLKLSSLHLVMFKHPYLIHMKSNSIKNSTIDSTFHFHLVFHFKRIFLPSNSKKILQSKKSFKVPPCIIIFWKSRWHFLLMRHGLWILTTWPSHSYALAYCRPVHLISIELQSIGNNLSTRPKNFLFYFNCYYLAICVVTLIVLFSTKIVRYKILRLKVKNNNFILIFILHVNKYIFEP